MKIENFGSSPSSLVVKYEVLHWNGKVHCLLEYASNDLPFYAGGYDYSESGGNKFYHATIGFYNENVVPYSETLRAYS